VAKIEELSVGQQVSCARARWTVTELGEELGTADSVLLELVSAPEGSKWAVLAKTLGKAPTFQVQVSSVRVLR
jgi:hypothetical protein